MPLNLSAFDRRSLQPGRSRFIQGAWFFLGRPLLRSPLINSYKIRCWLLRIFGASVGDRVHIKAGVRVKYPWKLAIGHQSWIGEDVWIDNVAEVVIGDNACLSQGCYLCTGNHDWSDVTFRLRAEAIVIENFAWVGAKAVIGPGVVVGEGAFLTLGTVAGKTVPPYEIHSGNPARFVRVRHVGDG